MANVTPIKSQVRFILNNGTTTSGSIKTVAVSLPSVRNNLVFTNNGDTTNAAYDIASAAGDCFESTLVRVEGVSTVSIGDE